MSKDSYRPDDAAVRESLRSSTAAKAGIPVDAATFAYDHDIKTGRTAAKTHPSLSPKDVRIRESRDSDMHPLAVPVGLTLDTTGSMQTVPLMLQKKLTHLMGEFLEAKASGKHYLGGGTPAILISAVDDYPRGTGAEGCLQVGQFEADIKIDDNLTNLWITGNGGGGVPCESYELALYFAARHTVHDHMEKRGRKGYWFLIGDEMAYGKVDRAEVRAVIGDQLQEDIPLEQIVAEAAEKYHIFYLMPNMTSHYTEPQIVAFWEKLLPQGHVILLADPEKICETMVGCVALYEEDVTIDDLKKDGLADGAALVALSAVAAGAVSRRGQYGAGSLPPMAGTAGSTDRL